MSIYVAAEPELLDSSSGIRVGISYYGQNTTVRWALYSEVVTADVDRDMYGIRSIIAKGGTLAFIPYSSDGKTAESIRVCVEGIAGMFHGYYLGIVPTGIDCRQHLKIRCRLPEGTYAQGIAVYITVATMAAKTGIIEEMPVIYGLPSIFQRDHTCDPQGQ